MATLNGKEPGIKRRLGLKCKRQHKHTIQIRQMIQKVIVHCLKLF